MYYNKCYDNVTVHNRCTATATTTWTTTGDVLNDVRSVEETVLTRVMSWFLCLMETLTLRLLRRSLRQWDLRTRDRRSSRHWPLDKHHSLTSTYYVQWSAVHHSAISSTRPVSTHYVISPGNLSTPHVTVCLIICLNWLCLAGGCWNTFIYQLICVSDWLQST